jgi:hypothetical protein
MAKERTMIRDHFIRITPARITGRAIGKAA